MNGNGNKRDIVFGVLVTVILALSGWTLKSVNEISVELARVQQDEAWVKTILIEQSKKKTLPEH